MQKAWILMGLPLLGGCLAMTQVGYGLNGGVRQSPTIHRDVRLTYHPAVDVAELVACPVLFPLSLLGGLLFPHSGGTREALALLIGVLPGVNVQTFARKERLSGKELREHREAEQRRFRRKEARRPHRDAVEPAPKSRHGWWDGR